ncbi:tripartite tricarboxylate transporter substrate binding protein [Diaphorobacter sp. MNS-0]|uniref:Bug family tripartite tricarboxylate transporter substrate binding protein n=1 Tax=Diaphorobacter sp. MNS-0 TaxID=2866628 RepID=UPI001C73DFDC|nr:tripartite tricarboxylate transporter substrate binding protein [Diaphorobacter sp. MNS-0]QYY25723.1 tripartite tricarboxylate transporter substrate binding protein [Diaphorobacter sp. MNS-0]
MNHEAHPLGWNRRHLLALAAATAAAGPLGARAQAAPAGFATRPVRVVVPFAAGGATDVIARILGERMAQRFGQSVVVDNKPGAAGLIAGEMVAKAPPDGMTALLGTTSSMLTNKYLYKKTPYDPLTELTPLVRVCLAPIALVVTADTPAQNLRDFMAWIRSQKGKLTYGSYGIGSHGQLACTTLSKVAGADMTHVAYKGEAPMVQDLLGGQIKIGMGSLLSLKAHVDAGKLRALAVTGPRRVPLLPEVPTFTEAGYPQDALSIVGWLAIAGPKAMPADVARQWALAANHAVASREGLARIIAAGFVPVDDDTPEKFARLWAQEAPVWGRLLQAAGVQPS